MARNKWRALSIVLSGAILLSLAVTPWAEAARRGRGSSSPFVMTPSGPIPKSVYYGYLMSPAQLQAQQMAEQAYLEKMKKQQQGSRTNGPASTTRKK